MAKTCCGPAREQRIEQYELSNWKVNETEYKTFKTDDTLYAAEYIQKDRDGLSLLIDPQSPNWMSVNFTGTEILRLCDGKHTVSDIQKSTAGRFAAEDRKKIYREVHDFLNAAGTLQFISEKPVETAEYKGRNRVIAPDKLDETEVLNGQVCLTIAIAIKKILRSFPANLERILL